MQALEDENTVAKQTIPSPAQFYEQMIFPMNAETTNKIYPNREELLEDVAKIYRAFHQAALRRRLPQPAA